MYTHKSEVQFPSQQHYTHHHISQDMTWIAEVITGETNIQTIVNALNLQEKVLEIKEEYNTTLHLQWNDQADMLIDILNSTNSADIRSTEEPEKEHPSPSEQPVPGRHAIYCPMCGEYLKEHQCTFR